MEHQRHWPSVSVTLTTRSREVETNWQPKWKEAFLDIVSRQVPSNINWNHKHILKNLFCLYVHIQVQSWDFSPKKLLSSPLKKFMEDEHGTSNSTHHSLALTFWLLFHPTMTSLFISSRNSHKNEMTSHYNRTTCFM